MYNILNTINIFGIVVNTIHFFGNVFIIKKMEINYKIFIALCTSMSIGAIPTFLNISLAIWDLIFAFSQIYGRTLFDRELLWKFSHISSHGSVSCLLLLEIYRTVFILRQRNRIRFGAYNKMPNWALFFYVTPFCILLILNVYFKYSCENINFENENTYISTLITNVLIPLFCFGTCEFLISRKIEKTPRKYLYYIKKKITSTEISSYRMAIYILFWTPFYVSV